MLTPDQLTAIDQHLRKEKRWRQAVVSHVQNPLLWRQTVLASALIILLSFFGYPPDSANRVELDSDFYTGFATGTLMGFLVLLVSLIQPYLKTVFNHGIHNVPTEVLYLITRHSMLLPIVYGIGVTDFFGILPLLPYPTQPLLISLYLMAIGLYVRTSTIIYESLYEVFPNR